MIVRIIPWSWRLLGRVLVKVGVIMVLIAELGNITEEFGSRVC